jgi:CRISPR/Cas system-associated protein Csx1
MSVGDKARALNKAHVLVKQARDRLRRSLHPDSDVHSHSLRHLLEAALDETEEAERQLDVVLGRPTD